MRRFSGCEGHSCNAAELPYDPFASENRGGTQTKGERISMLGWSVTFLIIALVAALFGFIGIAGVAAGIAKVLFVIFLVLFLVSLIFGRRAV